MKTQKLISSKDVADAFDKVTKGKYYRPGAQTDQRDTPNPFGLAMQSCDDATIEYRKASDTPAQPQHSPLPWHHRIETSHTRCAVTDYGYLEICDVYGIDRETRNANAAYIVKACNAYPDLVRLLDEAHEDNRTLIANAKYDRDKLKAHAERLAEALEHLLDVMVRVHGVTLPVQLGTFCEEQDWASGLRIAREALAQWEGAQQ